MRTKDYLKTWVFALALLCLLVPQRAFAAFSLTVRPLPYGGSDDLRFETVDPEGTAVSQVLKIDITSTIGRYELVQNLLTPLTNNAQGVSIPEENFIFYARRAATHGTLNFIGQDSSVRGVKNIYMSDTAGNSDFFELVYVLKSPLNVAPGLYNGMLTFVLRPIDSPTQPQIVKTLNIIAQVGRGESAIEITSATGARIISLNPTKEDMESFDVLVNIKGNVGSGFRILQYAPEPLTSSEGIELPYEAVNFAIAQVKKGSGPNQLTPLSARLDEVYKSGPRGEAESFIITYSLGDASKVQAGRYKTNIQYRLEGAGGFIKEGIIENFGLEVDIERLFDLAIKTESDFGNIEFLDLKPKQPPKTYEVVIEVNSNIGRRYQVGQNVFSELVSKEGETIPAKYFTLHTEKLETKGKLKLPKKTEVRKGETILLISDEEGSPDSFKIIYELAYPIETKAGSYSTSVAYSLSEI